MFSQTNHPFDLPNVNTLGKNHGFAVMLQSKGDRRTEIQDFYPPNAEPLLPGLQHRRIGNSAPLQAAVFELTFHGKIRKVVSIAEYAPGYGIRKIRTLN